MDASYQESLKKIDAVLAQHPELLGVARSLREGKELKNILDFEGVGQEIALTVEFETLLVIALFVPLSELGTNIAASTKISIDSAKRIALMLETLVLEPIADALRAYDVELRSGDEPNVPDANIGAKEKLELRPDARPVTPPTPGGQGTPTGTPLQSRPLTREELMNALGAKRTMASDMERARGGAPVPPPSYGASPAPKSTIPPPPPPASN